MTVAERTAVAAASPPPPAAASVPSAERTARLRFVGARSDYWRLMIRGNALQAVTLGLYRFWLFTDMRRFLWAGIAIEDENFEYIGTASELLIGFLMALGILVPVNMALFYALLDTGTLNQSTVMFVVLYAFGQFGVFRARAYRLTRTVLRGLRFHQTGSGVIFAGRAVLWWIVTFATAGLALPFMTASQERYKMRCTFFGNLGARFDGTGRQLLTRGLLLWFVVIAPLAVAVEHARRQIDWVVVERLLSSASLMSIIEAFGKADHLAQAGATVILALFWSTLAGIVLYPVFTAIVLRWWLSGIRLGGLAVASDLAIRPLYGIYIRYLFYLLMFTIAFSVAATVAVLMAMGMLSNVIDFSVTSTPRDAAIAMFGIAVYVIYMLGCWTIYYVTVRFRVWQAAIESVSVSGLAAIDSVEARPAHCSALGEGLADALSTGSI
jgi:uncharacterized membrane protein YjgN (DUF898 family)